MLFSEGQLYTFVEFLFVPQAMNQPKKVVTQKKQANRAKKPAAGEFFFTFVFWFSSFHDRFKLHSPNKFLWLKFFVFRD